MHAEEYSSEELDELVDPYLELTRAPSDVHRKLPK